VLDPVGQILAKRGRVELEVNLEQQICHVVGSHLARRARIRGPAQSSRPSARFFATNATRPNGNLPVVQARREAFLEKPGCLLQLDGLLALVREQLICLLGDGPEVPRGDVQDGEGPGGGGGRVEQPPVEKTARTRDTDKSGEDDGTDEY